MMQSYLIFISTVIYCNKKNCNSSLNVKEARQELGRIFVAKSWFFSYSGNTQLFNKQTADTLSLKSRNRIAKPG